MFYSMMWSDFVYSLQQNNSLSTTRIWNVLVSDCFHLTYFLHSFKTIVNRQPASASLPPGFSPFQKFYPLGNLTLYSKRIALMRILNLFPAIRQASGSNLGQNATLKFFSHIQKTCSLHENRRSWVLWNTCYIIKSIYIKQLSW